MKAFDGNKGKGRRWSALGLLCVAQFVVVLDVTIVAIALPEIQDELGFSQAGLQWVISAYTLVFGGFLLLGGRAADLWGRRRLFVIGLLVFSGASLACGLADSALSLVVARVVQGLGAAIVAPSALSLLTTAFPEGEGRGRALGVWTAAAAGGGATGWLLGGLLSGGLGWEWVFFVNVPVGVIGVALAPFFISESRDVSASPRLDLAGAVSVTVGLTLLVYGITRVQEVGLGAPETLVSLGVSVVFLAGFVAVEGRVKYPLVPLGIFRSRAFLGANLVALTLTASTTPPMLLCILYVQRVLGYSPAEAGLVFPPFNLAVIGGSLLGPRLVAWLGPRAVMAFGLLAIAAGTLCFLGISRHGGYLYYLIPGFVLMGSGLGCASVASTASGTSAADGGLQGLASGLLNSAAQIGTVLGLAVLVPLSAARAEALAGTMPAEAALVEGFRSAFFGAAGIAAVGIVVSLLIVRRKGA
ncbi:MAG TPA: MFS transporter [Rubrobacter sp.]|nr:MFS transporter [Rubrobacter sp.]